MPPCRQNSIWRKKRTALRRRNCLKRRKRLRKVSPKRVRENRIYARLRKVFLVENPICDAALLELPVVCTGLATEIHHKARRGRNYLKTETWAGLCANCHRWTEENGKAAEKLGLLIREYKTEAVA